MRPARLLFVCAAMLAMMQATVRADIVVLLNGREIEGRVTDLGDRVRIELPSGIMTISRIEVLSIEKRRTPEEELAVRRGTLRTGDALSARALARWCDDQGFLDDAQELMLLAAQWSLEAELLEIPTYDREAQLQFLRESAENGAPERVIRGAARSLLVHDPDDPEVRALVKEEWFRGRWVPREEVLRTLRSEESRAMADKGYVERDGDWMPHDRAAVLDERDRLRDERDLLRREIDAMRKERQELVSLRDSLEAELSEIAREREELLRLREELAARRDERVGVTVVIPRRRIRRDPCDPPGVQTPKPAEPEEVIPAPVVPKKKPKKPPLIKP